MTPGQSIVTGSDSGIGRASAVALARDGFDVGITWHEDEKGAREAAEEAAGHGVRVEVRRLDLAQLPEAARTIDELADALGGVDVLVNNAGTGISEAFLEQDFDHWRHVLAVDLDGPFLCPRRPRAAWWNRAVAGASSTSPRCTSTSRCGSRRPTARPRAASGS